MAWTQIRCVTTASFRANGHAGPLETTPLGDCKTPSIEAGPGLRLCQQHGGGVVEQGAHHTITGFGYVPLCSIEPETFCAASVQNRPPQGTPCETTGGKSTPLRNAKAVIGPTPGTVTKRGQT